VVEIKTSDSSAMATTATGSVWKNTNFVTLFFASSIVLFGGKVYELAIPLILYELTHSSVVMSAMRGIELLPNLFLAMFIGVLVDRVNKKRFMQLSILIQMLLLVGLYALIANGLAPVWVFYVAGFFLMTFNYSYENLRVTITKHAVPKELLTSANAKFSFSSTLVTVLGPTISGLILFLADLKDGLLITALCLCITLLISSRIQIEEPKKKVNDSTFMEDLRAGWRELRNNHPLWQMTMIVMFTNATVGMFSAMVIFYAKDTLLLSNTALGLVMSGTGLGGLTSTFIVAWVRKKVPTGKLYGLTILLLGVLYAAMYLATSAWMMGAILFLYGIVMTIQSVLVWTFRQETTPPEMIGRVTGITGSLFKLAAPFTMFGSGIVASLFGANYVFLLAGLGNLLIFFVVLRLSIWKRA
jgi:MFS family permease